MAIIWAVLWLVRQVQACWPQSRTPSNRPFYPRRRAAEPVPDDDQQPAPDGLVAYRPGFRRKKPPWVIDEVIYLKAVNPFKGCRKIADLFNRRHAAAHDMTVSKSYVYQQLKRHRYEVQVLRRHIKHRKPRQVPRNVCWGVDLTAVTDQAGAAHLVLAIVDYGSRRCLGLEPVADKRSFTLLRCLLKAVHAYGKPKSIKTDNEAVFTSRLFKVGLTLFNIKHQLSDVASPWQNGRVERFIGTFKERISGLAVLNQAQLTACLPEFVFWYNAIRPHQHLDGKTPLEAWHGVDVFTEQPKRVYRFDAWEGLLTGYYLLT